VNHQLESRMLEICMSGSEGGGVGTTDSPYPYRLADKRRAGFDTCPSALDQCSPVTYANARAAPSIRLRLTSRPRTSIV